MLAALSAGCGPEESALPNALGVCKIAFYLRCQGRRVIATQENATLGVRSLLQTALVKMTPLGTWQRLLLRANGLVFTAGATF